MNHSDDDLRQATALFRYGVIADLVHLPVGTPGLIARMRDKATQSYAIPGTTRTRVAANTIRDWIKLYRDGGAGKSTTIKSIIGLARPAKGEIAFEGRSIRGLEPFQINRLGLGYVPEDRRVFTGLTIAENLEVGRQPRRENAPEWTPEKLFALFPNLATMSHRLGGLMSGGEQQMLTIARTLMGNPTMLLDEPSEGLAPVIVEQVASTILDLKAQSLSILLSEQNLNLSTRVSDRAYIIEKGRIRYAGSMAELAENEEIRAAYLMV